MNWRSWFRERRRLLTVAGLGALGASVLGVLWIGFFPSDPDGRDLRYDVSADEKTVLFAPESDQAPGLYEVDTTTGTVVRAIEGTRCHDASYVPGARTAVAAMSAPTGTVFDIRRVDLDLPGAPAMTLTRGKGNDFFPRVRPGTRTVVFVRGLAHRPPGLGIAGADDCDWYVCPLTGGAAVRLTSRHFAGVGPMAFTPDGAEAYFEAEWPDQRRHEILRFDFRAGKLTSFPGLPRPDEVAALPAGRGIAALLRARSAGQPDLVLFDQANRPLRTYPSRLLGSYNERISISSDGRHAYYLTAVRADSVMQFDLRRLDLSTGANTRVVGARTLLTAQPRPVPVAKPAAPAG